VVFGPYAAQWLGDLGAEVIKVEAPAGDSTRNTGPSKEAGMAAVFLGSNRNKQSLCLDLKSAEGQDALGALVSTADVFMHNMRPQKIAALGFDARTLCARHPRLIYASFHGYGEGGPYAGRPAYDDVIQGQSGIADLFHLRDGQPAYAPTIMADKTCGLVGAMGIMAALLKRERTGSGGEVEIPMFETMTAFNLVEHLYGHHFDPPQGGAGYARMTAAWRRPYPTADGFICMLPYTDAHWLQFFTDAGHPELAHDPRFTGIAARTSHIQALYAEAARIALTRTTDEWLAYGLAHEIPMARVNTLGGLVDDPHLQAVRFFTEVQDPQMGRVRWPGVPVKFDGQRPPVHMAPRLGEHNAPIMRSAGYSAADIERLTRQGVLFQPAPQPAP
jgi:crotonobetainyl-CoA:carnitine CoA-transferase CaiB-like acyl-CoA transferase